MLSQNIDQIKSDLNINKLDETKYFPKYFEIETVNACNARCIMCTVQEWNLSKSDEYIMSMELFEKFVEEVSHYSDWIETVCLNRDGEPTLDKHLVQRVKMLKDVGIKKVTFSTNAQNLSNELIAELLDAGLDDIMISIDGFSKNIFETIRKKLDFDKVMENTLNFIKTRNQLNSKCSIRIRAVKMDENQHELEQWLTFWNDQLSDRDRAYIMPMHSWGNQSYEEQDTKVKYYSNKACISPFSTMILHVDGTAPLCGCDYSVKHLLGKFPQESIKEIWNSDGFEKIRFAHENSNRNEIELCQGCNIWDKNYEE